MHYFLIYIFLIFASHFTECSLSLLEVDENFYPMVEGKTMRIEAQR